MMARRLKVLIIGGSGIFGGRLAQLLADEERSSADGRRRRRRRFASACSRGRPQSRSRSIGIARSSVDGLDRQVSGRLEPRVNAV
jgi:hypothetical protein